MSLKFYWNQINDYTTVQSKIFQNLQESTEPILTLSVTFLRAITKIKEILDESKPKMVGSVDRTDDIRKALKLYIQRDRDKERQEDEAEAEKTRKKKEEDEKKLKVETEFKATKDKIAELTKKYEHLKTEKVRIFEYLKKLLFESNKYRLDVDDIAKLYEIGLAVPTHVSTVANHPPVHATTRIPSPIITRAPAVSVGNQYKASATTVMPVQAIPPPKRNRSPSPVYRPPYAYKQAAGPHPFQKLEDPHRNHEYNRSYLYPKPGNAPPSSNYGAFYPPGQGVAYSHPPQPLHGGSAVYGTYNANRDSVDSMHKSQSPTGPTSSAPSQHSSLYAHRSPAPSGPPPTIQSNHVYHPKDRGPYQDDKYYMVRSGGHVPVHGVLSIQQPPQVTKHGSITSGYPVRPVATSMNPQAQLHIQPPHGGHHPSSSSHHPSLSSHHSSSSHQPHHPSSGVHYPSSHHGPPSSQSAHPSQQPPSSVSSHHGPPSHHQQHMQQMHVSPHHPPPNSHHQLLSHHSSPSMHHSQAIHHPPSHHPSSLHHQPHIQHISTHSSPSQHPPGQQSQPTSVVTSQAYANQLSAIQGGSRVVYSQPPH